MKNNLPVFLNSSAEIRTTPIQGLFKKWAFHVCEYDHFISDILFSKNKLEHIKDVMANMKTAIPKEVFSWGTIIREQTGNTSRRKRSTHDNDLSKALQMQQRFGQTGIASLRDLERLEDDQLSARGTRTKTFLDKIGLRVKRSVCADCETYVMYKYPTRTFSGLSVVF